MTAPSLDVGGNVSGVATVVRELMKELTRDRAVTVEHVLLGRSDRDGAPRTPVSQMYDAFRQVRRSRVEGLRVILHVNTALNDRSIVRDTVLVLYAKFLRIPVLVHIHGGKYYDHQIPLILRVVLRLAINFANGVMVLGESERIKLSNFVLCHTPIVSLPNAITVPDISTSRRRKSKSVINFVFLGRLEEEKGLEDFLEVLKSEPELASRSTLEIFGDGSLAGELVPRFAAVLGDRFRYGGRLMIADKYEVLAKYDVLVLPSRRGEGLPMAMLEAMSVGVVPIAPYMASIPEVVEHLISGFLFTTGQIDSLRACFLMAHQNSQQLEEMGRRAREVVVARHSIGPYADAMMEIYSRVTSRG